MNTTASRRLFLGGLLAAAAPRIVRAQGPPPQVPGQRGPRPEPPRPTRKQVLAWADIRNGQQHDSVTRALVTIEKLGRESGLYDTYIRTDSQLITKQPILSGGRPIT